MCMFCRSLLVFLYSFLSAIVLSVLFCFTDSDYPFGIFKLFFGHSVTEHVHQRLISMYFHVKIKYSYYNIQKCIQVLNIENSENIMKRGHLDHVFVNLIYGFVCTFIHSLL